MGFERLHPRGFVSAVLLRAVLLAALLIALVFLVREIQYYATILVVVLCAALVVADLAILCRQLFNSVDPKETDAIYDGLMLHRTFRDHLAHGAMMRQIDGSEATRSTK